MKGKLKVIVIGGLSAGPSAAAKARRENEQAEIILFEKGANISYATCGIPYALSGIIENRDKLLVVEAQLLQKRFNIDVRLEEEVLRVDTKNKIVYTSKGEYDYDKLMFSTGAQSIVPTIKNIELATNWSTCRSINDYDKIIKEGLSASVKKVTVVGAGLIGVEVAENLAKAGKEVTLIEGATNILPMWSSKFGVMAEQELREKGIKIISSTRVREFHVDDKFVRHLGIGEGKKVETDYVILSIGIKPNTQMLIDNGAKHLANGALLVNEYMETSIKDVYAAGDNVALKNLQTNKYDYFPLGTHSNKGGRTAGANLSGAHLKFKGAYKTAIVQVFDYTLARTGMSVQMLQENEIKYKTILSVSGATPSYYPDPKDVIIELYYDAETEKLLAAELYGEKGVDKRVDVLSTAIYAGLKLSDLAQLDLAYAPPFSPAKDPVVVSSFIAENSTVNSAQQIDVEELRSHIQKESDNYTLLDVRTLAEIKEGVLPNAIHIPLDDLRDRLEELRGLNGPFFVYCAKGLRGYLATRILKHNDFEPVFNIAGGYKMWTKTGGVVSNFKLIEQ